MACCLGARIRVNSKSVVPDFGFELSHSGEHRLETGARPQGCGIPGWVGPGLKGGLVMCATLVACYFAPFRYRWRGKVTRCCSIVPESLAVGFPCLRLPGMRRGAWVGLREVLFRLNLGPEIGRGKNRDDFEFNQIIPAAGPWSQRFWVGRFHQLETTSACWVHPARVIHHALGQHTTVSLESLANWFRVAILKSLDDHKQHERECSRSCDRCNLTAMLSQDGLPPP